MTLAGRSPSSGHMIYYLLIIYFEIICKLLDPEDCLSVIFIPILIGKKSFNTIHDLIHNHKVIGMVNLCQIVKHKERMCRTSFCSKHPKKNRRLELVINKKKVFQT